jgi:hypothetical protein
MTTLYHFAAPVKPARRFGAGLLAARPSYRADHTAADEAWLVEDNARRERAARELDRLVDELYEESEATRRLEAGLCC